MPMDSSGSIPSNDTNTFDDMPCLSEQNSML